MIILDFEKPIFDLEANIKELKSLNAGDLNVLDEVRRLEQKHKKLLKQIYSELTPWNKVAVARHQNRPHTREYIEKLVDDFVPLAGDRAFGNDCAITAGIGKFMGISVAIIGHEKGNDTEERIKCNFGMPHPEGYRKAVRVMDLADRFHLPLLTFVDTAGAFPGIGAEERGQAEAIAKCIERSLKFNGPIVATIIGEGGSGGAVALSVANTILMLEHSIYSVISPEGCASILHRNTEKTQEAAVSLKLTSSDLLGFKMIDYVVNEPVGGAHRDHQAIIKSVGDAIKTSLSGLYKVSDLKAHRNNKFLNFCRSYKV